MHNLHCIRLGGKEIRFLLYAALDFAMGSAMT